MTIRSSPSGCVTASIPKSRRTKWTDCADFSRVPITYWPLAEASFSSDFSQKFKRREFGREQPANPASSTHTAPLSQLPADMALSPPVRIAFKEMRRDYSDGGKVMEGQSP
jgi:hypothetical protein